MKYCQIDEIVSLEPGEKLVAQRTLRADEDYLQDHFPAISRDAGGDDARGPCIKPRSGWSEPETTSAARWCCSERPGTSNLVISCPLAKRCKSLPRRSNATATAPRSRRPAKNKAASLCQLD